MTRWLDPEPIDVPDALQRVVGGHPLVVQTLVRRGMVDPAAVRAFLDPAAYTLASPLDLPDMDQAVERLRQAIAGGEPVAVWGDFDADGQTATALLVEALAGLGAAVSWGVPARAEGHGLSLPAVQRLVAAGARLIVTCDTGVTAYSALEEARRLGVEAIVTDHHMPGDSLPPAVAVVNPMRLAAGHPLRPLTGVGVAYVLARALDPAVANRSLDLVALGTVADVGSLTGDNRPLVQRGLEALRHTVRPGLQALYQAAEVRPEGLTEEHAGFVLGPRLNALGRLADAAAGVELLLTADPTRAAELATQVESLNAQRQWLTRQVTTAALAQIENEPALVEGQAMVVLSSPAWPPGVTGIVAGRLAERFGKPAALVATPPGEAARASARSVPGVDLMAVLRDCAPLLLDYGGHPGAAGFAIAPEHLPELRACLSEAVARHAGTLPERTLPIDSYVELSDLDLRLVAHIGRLAPFGRGNPPLVLGVRDLRLLGEATLGRQAEHRRLTVEDRQDRTATVFWWQGAGWPLPRGRFDLAVTIRSSDYRGLPEVQVEWLAARELEPAEILEPEPAGAPRLAVRDHRTAPDAESVLRRLLAEGDVQVWAEGSSPTGVGGRTRRELVAGGPLAIWTAPPGPRELGAALKRAAPDEMVLFCVDAGLDRAGPFLQRLAGVARFALRSRRGWIELEAAAAVLGHRPATVRVGLEWLAASGQVRIVEKNREGWRLGHGEGAAEAAAVQAARRQLDALLAETAAYRAYLRTAPAEAVLQTLRVWEYP